MDIRQLLRSPSPDSRPAMLIEETTNTGPNDRFPLGLLSKTVFRSPIIKWILPARIRDSHHNDVIFVGENFIELKEIRADGYIRHLAHRTEFGYGIHAARILGYPLDSVSIKDDEEVVSKKQTNGASNGTSKGIPNGALNGVSDGIPDSTPDGTSNGSRRLPPQVLVLTLKTSEIVFVYASTNADGRTTFSTYSHPIPIFTGSSLHQPGTLLAVDANSRAIAVAATQNNLVIAKTTPSSRCESLDEVLKDMIVYDVGMTILRMEFLCPSAEDRSQVSLLLIGSEGTQVIHWDDCQALTSDAITTKHYRFGLELRTPNLVIPLKEPGSFMLVTESGLAIFKDAHIGSLRNAYWHPRTPDDDSPRFPGLSLRFPLWTNWTRPVRGNHYFFDDIYLAREDGVIWWLRVAHNSGDLCVLNQSTAGVLHTNIGTAFAALDLHISEPDVLVSGGDLCDGGVYVLGQSLEFGHKDEPSRAKVMRPDQKNVISNWAPFTDVASTKSDHERSSTSKHRSQLYATTGKGPNGAISELRYGLELAVKRPIVSEELDNASNIWPLQRMDCVVLSFPEHSSVLYGISSDNPHMVTLSDERTLAVAVLERSTDPGNDTVDITGVTVHITTSSAQLLRLDPLNPVIEYGPLWAIPGITIAAIEPLDLLVVLVIREYPRSLVQLKTLVILEGQWQFLDTGQPIVMEEEPSCVSFFRDGPRRTGPLKGKHESNLVILGTESGSIHILRADLDHGLAKLLSRSLESPLGSEPGAACESVSVVVNQKASIPGLDNHLLALCGMRDGVLHAVELRVNHTDGALKIAKRKAFTIGETPVRAVLDTVSLGCAVIHCDKQVLYMFCRDLAADRARIMSVWFTCLTNRALTNCPVLDLCQLPAVLPSHGLSCRLACVTRTGILVGQLDDDPKPLPRLLKVPGTPSRTLYMAEQKVLVVASTVIVTETRPVPKRFPLLAVTLVRPSEDQVDLKLEHEFQPEAKAHYMGAPGERLCGLTEWCCTRGDTRWQFIVVSTANTALPGQRPTGNLIFLQVLSYSTGMCGIRADQVKSEDAPVTAICQYGLDSLVYFCGTELRMRTFLFDERIFKRKLLVSLNSPGVYITTKAPFIYVTTKEHSVRVFKFEDQTLIPITGDCVAREGLAHLSLPVCNLLLLTDKRGSVAAIRESSQQSDCLRLPAVFEARFHCSITRICKAAIRPSWKESHVHGVMERDLLGTATDGSLISFNILEGASWRLLRFVQNMCMRDERVCEFTPRAYEENVHLEPRGKSPTDLHVDGDILERLVEDENACQVLNDMLDAEPHSSTHCSRVDYATAKRRRARFEELVDELFEGSSVEPTKTVESAHTLSERKSNPVEVALDYIRTVLESPF